MPDCNDVLRLLPVLKGIPVACLLALLLAGPLDLAGLALATGYTRGRVLVALGMLETLGLACATGELWSAKVSLESELQPAEAESSLDSRRESLNLELSLVTKLDSEDKKTEELGEIEVEKILDHAAMLFGEPVLMAPGVEVEAPRLMGLLAEAYTNRRSLRKPARVVAANLKAGRSPSLRFMANPLAYLPADFIRELEQAPGYDLDEEGEDLEMDDSQPASPVSGPAAEPSAAQRLWQEARQELQQTMPRTLYENFIRPVQALDFDPDEGALFLQAGSAQACGWLDERLKRTLERLLIGIYGEAVQVVFLAPEDNAGQSGGGA